MLTLTADSQKRLQPATTGLMKTTMLMVVLLQVAGILTGNTELVGRSLDSDVIIEPVRGPLIPSFFAVKQAAKAAGKCCRQNT